MNVLLRGIIGGFSCGGAPLPSGAGCTRHPLGCVSGGGVLSAGESGGRAFNVLRARTPQRGFPLRRPGHLAGVLIREARYSSPVYMEPGPRPLTRGLFVINDISIGTLAAPSPAHSTTTSGVVRGVRKVA